MLRLRAGHSIQNYCVPRRRRCCDPVFAPAHAVCARPDTVVGPTALCWRACRCVGVVFCDGDWCVCSVFHILEQEVAAAAEAGSASNKHRRCVQHEPVPWAREPMALLCTGNCLLAQQSERGSLWTVSTTSIRPLNYLGGTIRWPVVRTADPQSRCVLTARAGVRPQSS